MSHGATGLSDADLSVATDPAASVGQRRPGPMWRRAEVWSAVFWTLYAAWRLSGVPGGWWRWRDDAVITLSHARGWVDFGVPSVSAAGERVEGYSAPLQMLLASAFYRLGGSGWERFLDVQVVLGLALSGCFVAYLLRVVVPGAGEAALVAGSSVAAVVGLSTWAALGWMVSGMENSLTVPLLLATMVALVGVLTFENHRGYALGLAVGLAGITRTELAVLLIPTLAIAVIGLWRSRRHVALRSVAIAVSIWAAAYLWRLATFRTLLPNSAVVQDRTDLAIADVAVLVALAVPVVAVVVAWGVERLRMLAAVGLGLTLAIVGILAVTSDAGWAIAGLTPVMTIGLAGATVVAATVAVIGVGGHLAWVAILVVGWIPAVQQTLFGAARLDANRIGAESLILLSSAAGVVVAGAIAASPADRRAGAARAAGAATAAVLAAIGIAFVVEAAERSEPERLCCEIAWYSTVLDEAASHSSEVGLPRSIVATPDLGKYSFAKEAIVVDLGYLGDPVMAELKRLRPDVIETYLRRVQVPDLFEVHGVWVCSTYANFVESDSFAERYELARVDDREGAIDGCRLDGRFQYYRRSLDEPGYQAEVELTAQLTGSPIEAPAAAASAAVSCVESDGDALRCQWVRRAILRASPELRDAGTMEATVDAFAAVSPTGEIDRLLLNTPPGFARPAAESLVQLLER